MAHPKKALRGEVMENIVVTGGAGFVGSHLCDAIIAQDQNVICMDDLSTGRRKNIAHLEGKNFKFFEHDVTEPISAKADAIFNLACPASPVHYQADPIRTFKTNVYGALNVLELARAQNIPVIHSSTSEVYGDPQVHPQTESYWGHVNPTGIRACYDEGKRGAETLCFDYQRQHNVQVKVARIFNTYGPRMRPDDGRVVSNFIVSALAGEDLTVYGDGSQTRSFCYVDDMVAAFSKLKDSDPSFSGPVNLGNPGEFTILELADLVLSFVGGTSKIANMDLPQDDPRQRKPDISLAKSALGWEPKVDLKDGLLETIAYFRSTYFENAGGTKVFA